MRWVLESLTDFLYLICWVANEASDLSFLSCEEAGLSLSRIIAPIHCLLLASIPIATAALYQPILSGLGVARLTLNPAFVSPSALFRHPVRNTGHVSIPPRVRSSRNLF